MQDTLLANIGCLAVFQVAGADARTLVWELDPDRVAAEDITSLPVHHCYVRATVGTERLPAFSLAVRPPSPGDPATAARLRAAMADYTTAAEALHSRELARHELVAQYHEGGGGPETGQRRHPRRRSPRRPPRRAPAPAALQAPAVRWRLTNGGQRAAGLMALTGGPAVALRLLATMPFLDRLDLVPLAGWSRGDGLRGRRPPAGPGARRGGCPMPRLTSPPPDAFLTSPPPGCTGWRQTPAGPWRPCCTPTRSPPSGNACCCSGSMPSLPCTGSPPLSPRLPAHCAGSGIGAGPADAALTLPDGPHHRHRPAGADGGAHPLRQAAAAPAGGAAPQRRPGAGTRSRAAPSRRGAWWLARPPAPCSP